METLRHDISPPTTAPGGPARRASSLVVSTYPPTQCGLATFAAALVAALVRQGWDQTAVARAGGQADARHPDVVASLDPDDAGSVRSTARVAGEFDHLIVQHEFGIWGRHDGIAVLDLLEAAGRPATVTLHTVPSAPTRGQRHVLESLGESAAALVVMTRAARSRLLATCRIDPSRVATIAHGARVVADPGPLPRTPSFLTWGLLGPGKGIESVIDAVAIAAPEIDDLEYVVAGQTHPKVRERSGEDYRRSLVERAHDLGVARHVRFDDAYRTVDEVTAMALRSRAVVLPYESTDQVTSGVLVDALAAGRPVVATAFPHALELLGGGAGIVVSHRSPRAIADALVRIARHDGETDEMARRARRMGARHSWDLVARSYGLLADSLAGIGGTLNAATGA